MAGSIQGGDRSNRGARHPMSDYHNPERKPAVWPLVACVVALLGLVMALAWFLK